MINLKENRLNQLNFKSFSVLLMFMIESVINDWDGFLYNSMDAILRTYSIISGKPFEVIRKLYNPDWRRFQREANIPEVSDTEWHRIFREQSSNAKLFPGAKKYLQKIKDDRYKTALATSADLPRIKTDLEKCNLSNTFDTVVTLEDVKDIKPSSECLKVAARKLDSDIQDCVYVGDTEVDALAAKNIGMKFIGVSWGYHPPEVIRRVNEDDIANSFDELYMMIKKLGN